MQNASQKNREDHLNFDDESSLDSGYSPEKEEEIKNYLDKVMIDENDPGLMFTWNVGVLMKFARLVNAAIEDPDRVAAVPEWISRNQRGHTTSQLLMEGMIDFMSRRGGGSCHWTLLAPNTAKEFGKVVGALDLIQNNAFMQTTMRILHANELAANPEKKPSYLAHIAFLPDKNPTNWEDFDFQDIQPGYVHLFN